MPSLESAESESGTPVGAPGDEDETLEAVEDLDTSDDRDATSPVDAPPATRMDIDVIDNDFDPSPLRVAVGASVTWTNIGDLPHTVTADGFDSGIMSPGDSFEWTFDEAGTYDYVCALHPGMAGRIVVEAAAGETEPALGASAGAEPASTRSSPGNSVAFAVFMAGGLAVAGVGMAVGVGRFTKAIDTGSLR